MARRFNGRIGGSLLAVALVAILVSAGILAACSRAQTTTSAPTRTTTSTTASTTASTATTTSTRTTTTTTTTASAPAPTGVSAADFFRSNVVSIVVPYVPGGTTDIAARVFASYWTEATGGRMIVENKDGGGGIFGANYVYAAKPDGLTMAVGIPGAGLLSPALGQDPAVKYDLNKLNWIEATNAGEVNSLAVGPKSPYQSMGDFSKASGLKFASSSRYGTTSLGAALFIELFALKDARIVTGYGGTPEAILAVAKGEVDAYVSSGLMDSLGKGLIKKPLVVEDFQRSANYPDVPAIPELLKLSPDQENLLKTLIALAAGQVFWLPPGVPQDRVDFVRNTFDKIAASDAFKKQSLLTWPIYVKPINGKDFTAQIQATLAVVTPQKYSELKLLVDKYTR